MVSALRNTRCIPFMPWANAPAAYFRAGMGGSMVIRRALDETSGVRVGTNLLVP